MISPSSLLTKAKLPPIDNFILKSLQIKDTFVDTLSTRASTKCSWSLVKYSTFLCCSKTVYTGFAFILLILYLTALSSVFHGINVFYADLASVLTFMMYNSSADKIVLYVLPALNRFWTHKFKPLLSNVLISWFTTISGLPVMTCLW